MKMDARCTYCLLSRVHYEAKLSTNDDELIHKTMLAGIDVLKDTYVPGVPAGVVSTAIQMSNSRTALKNLTRLL